MKFKLYCNGFYFTFLFICLTIERVSTLKCDDPVITFRHGNIQGNCKNESGFTFYEFLGIRYGQVPKRFKYSQVNEQSWTGILNATSYGAECKQLDNPKSVEDCLFINIWRPLIPNNETLLPVFVWVHGSGYQRGSGAMNPGDVLASYGNMIVATINYRLGSIGYAYGDKDEIQGNQGVSDVLTALHWIRENIVYFAGDPNQVTLAGHSAGSMIISMLPVLPNFDQSLYSRLLLSSGVSFGPMFIENTSTSLAKTKLLSTKVGCGSETPGPLTRENISCLQTVNSSVLLKHDAIIKIIGTSDIVAFFPIYGTPFLPSSLTDLFWSSVNSTDKKQILFYLQKDETSNTTIDLQPNSRAEAYQMVWDKLSFIKKDLIHSQMQPFFEYYFNETKDNDTKALRTALTNFINDHTFRCTSLMLAELYSTHHSVRFAEFQYILDKYGQQKRPDGAWHDDVVEVFFGDPLRVNNFGSYSDQDRRQSYRLMTMLSDFTHGIEPNDWPEVLFDSSDIEKKPVIREIDFHDKNVEYSKQHICLEWSKLLSYNITTLS